MRRERLSRRALIKAMGGSALTLALYPVVSWGVRSDSDSIFRPNAFLDITSDNRVIFWIKKCEMGQQIHRALTAIVGDELGIDVDDIEVRQAPTHSDFGFIGTGGSFAVIGFWSQYRPLFAAAREMLIEAAAESWELKKTELETSGGRIHHRATRRSAPFGEFTQRAAKLNVPKDPPLRTRDSFCHIGKIAGRADINEILTGKAVYGADLRLQNLRYAAISKAPMRGGKLRSFDRSAAIAVGGVEQVVQLDDLIAVVASNSWSAVRGRDRLNARWSLEDTSGIDSYDIQTRLEEALAGGGQLVREAGTPFDGKESFDELHFYYEWPMAQHAAIETVTATALVTGGTCTVWGSIQMATAAQGLVASALGMEEDDVTIHTMLIGGAFGRKLESGFAVEAARIAARVEGPIQLVYTREDDMRCGGVRPPSHQKLSFRLDRALNKIALNYTFSAASTFAQQDPSQLVSGKTDWSAAMGAIDIPYTFDHFQLHQTDIEIPEVPLNWWRGTYLNNHVFASECAIDELAEVLDRDPLELRLSLLSEDLHIESYPGDVSEISMARLRNVLEIAASESAYDHPRPSNQAVGLACHCYGDVSTYVAHAVEVRVESAEVKIIKVTAVVDCGLAISPDGVRAQMEGCIAFGLTSALWGDLDISGGEIGNLNFDTCRVMRMAEMPPVDVHIVASEEAPGGMGEPPLPSVTPAFLNAVVRAGGPRIRRLPVGDQLELV